MTPPSDRVDAASVRAVADEIADFLGAEDRRMPPSMALADAADSTRSRWTRTLDRTKGRVGSDDELLRGILDESLAEADGMDRCTMDADAPPAPVGPACYGALLRLTTALPLTASQVRDIGVAMRLELEPQISALATRYLGVSTSVEARARLTDDPRYRYASPDSLLEGSRRYLAKARAALPLMVRVVPTDSLELVVIPEEQARNIAAGAYFNPPRPDRPARFFLNTLQASSRPRAAAATASFHEGWPGHHFQFARHKDLQPVHPAVAGVRSTAFVEGWGLYSERLADEFDLYDTPEERIGYLLHMQDAMVALQVDSGIHAFGWTREEAVDTMVMVGGRPRAQAEQYADRHLATPGQMVSYLIGYREILALREEARHSLGDAFDIRDFHEALLAVGPLPLGLVRASVERWIARTGEGGEE